MTRAILGIAVVLLAAGCGGYGGKSKSGEGGGEGGKTTVAGVSANNHGTKSVSGSADVELDDYYFEPTVLKGKPGSSITLELENKGSVEHNFTIDSQGVDKDLEPGKKAEVTVTIPKSGSISFYCKYHKRMGMAGALEGGANGGMTGGGSTTTGSTSTGKGY